MSIFVRVWIFLLALTGVEVALAYVHASPGVMLAALLGLSILKAVYIIAYFMHMKYERPLLKWALFPPVILMILALLMLLPDAARAQCVQCKRTAEAQNAERGVALNRGIVLLLAPAMVVLGGLALHARRASRH
ncbi:MAG: cytochrome C oxidase subunit IV family protein [Bryobacteraceae bacterium]